MHDAAILKPGPGFQPRHAALYYAQRLVTWPLARAAVRRGLAFCINQAHPLPASGPAAAEEALATLRGQGVAGLDALVPEAQARAMAAWFRERRVVSPHGRMRVEELPAGPALASYPLATVLACPGVVELINHPRVLRLAAAYLGCTPTLSSLGARWSLPAPERARDVQSFHRDHDDWRTVKLFVYLTDVGPDCGPHEYVRGSHRTAAGLRARPLGREEVAARFGAGRIEAVTGPAGTSFMADVHGVHRGGVPSGRPRLMLQAQYSILPVFAFRYEPVPMRPARPIDPHVNRLLIRLA